LVFTIIAAAGRILFSAKPAPPSQSEMQSGSARNRWLAYLTLLIVFGLFVIVISTLFELTSVGTVVLACALTGFALVCCCTPNLVTSQRERVTLPMLQILEMRLRGLPVQQFVRTVSILRGEGLRCGIELAEQVYRETKIAHAGELAEAVQLVSEKQDIRLFHVDPAGASLLSGGDERSVGHHVTMLLGTVAGFGIIGFFFVVTSGAQHLDNLLVARQWTETDGTVTLRIPPLGRDHSARYRFSYRVEQVDFAAECFGPLDFAEGATKVQYDQNEPSVACLVGGWRADGMPFFAMFFAALLALCIFPLPIIIGHIVAAVWAG